MVPLIAAGIGLGLSALGESQRKNAQQKSLDARKRSLQSAKYTTGEKESVLAGIGRSYNTKNLGAQNSAALGLDRVLNSDTLRGLNSSRLLGQRTEALVTAESGIDQHNKEMDSQIAGVGDPDPTNIGNIIAGGLAGYQAGEALDNLSIFNNPDSPTAQVNQTTQSGNYRGTGADLDGVDVDNIYNETPVKSAQTGTIKDMVDWGMAENLESTAKQVSPAINEIANVGNVEPKYGWEMAKKYLETTPESKQSPHRSPKVLDYNPGPGNLGTPPNQAKSQLEMVSPHLFNAVIPKRNSGTQRVEGSKRYEDQERYTGILEEVGVTANVGMGNKIPLKGVSADIRKLVEANDLEGALKLLNSKGSTQAMRQNVVLRDWILNKLGR